MEGGYTAYMVDALQRPRVVFINGNKKTIGGPGSVTLAMVQRCLSRMAGWVRLSLQCMEYEYPSWHLLLSFSVFDLCSKEKKRRMVSVMDSARSVFRGWHVLSGAPQMPWKASSVITWDLQQVTMPSTSRADMLQPGLRPSVGPGASDWGGRQS